MKRLALLLSLLCASLCANAQSISIPLSSRNIPASWTSAKTTPECVKIR